MIHPSAYVPIAGELLANQEWVRYLTVELPRSMGLTVYTVANLPTVAAPFRAFVSDADSNTFASGVVGGGSNFVPVFFDGAVWRIG